MRHSLLFLMFAFSLLAQGKQIVVRECYQMLTGTYRVRLIQNTETDRYAVEVAIGKGDILDENQTWIRVLNYGGLECALGKVDFEKKTLNPLAECANADGSEQFSIGKKAYTRLYKGPKGYEDLTHTFYVVSLVSAAIKKANQEGRIHVYADGGLLSRPTEDKLYERYDEGKLIAYKNVMSALEWELFEKKELSLLEYGMYYGRCFYRGDI